MSLEFSFYTIAFAISKLFILMLFGYILHHFKFIDDKFVDTLSKLLISLFFPALIISKTTRHFNFFDYPYWWFLPVAAAVFVLIGMILGASAVKLMRNKDSQREFICSSAFHNCGYLPMNIILFAFSGAISEKLLVYTFIFISGFNFIFWSFAPVYLAGKSMKEISISKILNPPVLATIFSLIWVFVMGGRGLPHIIADPVNQVGIASFPISMLVVGAYLSKHRAYNPEHKLKIAIASVIKLLIFPGVILSILIFIPFSPEYKFSLFLQSLMPTAVSLVIVGGYSGGDNKFLSSVIFYTHLIAVASIPVWLGFFKYFIMK